MAKNTSVALFRDSITESDRQRFFAKFDQGSYDECWPWTASRRKLGYGRFVLAGRQIASSRAAYLIFHGDIPEGALVCHRCDNPPCVNPAHLFLGTVEDNAVDAWYKGRLSAGERHPGAKLTEQQVREALHAYRTSNISQLELAKRYGVHKATMHLVLSGANWKKVWLS